ncbi:MAG: hypothetical protein GKR96_03365 [Gammaproteobacteria bacterium]|nr:hypothetical protein [Gammaproteobacteria bacterium]
MVEEANEERLGGSVKRILILQVTFAVITLAIIFGYFYSAEEGESVFDYLKAVGFGSLLGIGNTILSARSVQRSSRAVLVTPTLAMLPVYAGLLNKLVLIGGGVAFGLIALGLKPLFVVMGYFIVQAAFIIASIKPSN